MSKTKFCQGLSDISDSYSGFILDQWGVLHDGKEPYEHVIETLEELKSRKKEIIILSNSGKRVKESKKRLKKLGIKSKLYSNIVTAGEMAWEGLKTRNEGIFKGLGNKCFLLSRKHDTSIIDDTDIVMVDSPSEADFILFSGSNTPESSIDSYELALKEAVKYRLKGICANPDMHAIFKGKTYPGTGQIAKRYQEFGGVVDYIGKPHPPILRKCLSLFKNALPSSTVIVGDSLHHDILAGALLEIDTALVKTGIHAGSFKKNQTPAEVDKVISGLAVNYGVKPTYLLDEFAWGEPLPDRKHRKNVKKKKKLDKKPKDRMNKKKKKKTISEK